MRKVKFALLFVLILCLTVGILTACNPTGEGGGAPVIPTPEPGDTGVPDNSTTLSATEAWDVLIDAARKSNSDTGHYVYSDVLVGLDYAKDAVGYSYAFKVQTAIDLESDTGNQILFELWKKDAEGNLSEVLLGVYYYDSTLVYDCTGLRSGATIVKTDNINATAVVRTLRELLSAPGSDEYKSLAQFILNDLLTMDEGIVAGVMSALPALFGPSRLVTNPDGTQQLTMPVPLSGLLGTVLGGLLTPGPDSLIPEDVYDLVEDILGIDLALLSSIQDLSIYLTADLTADNGEGRELAAVDLGIGVDFDTFGTELEEIYGSQQSRIDISFGGEEDSRRLS